jgi:phosphate transport system substrate-binding protein
MRLTRITLRQHVLALVAATAAVLGLAVACGDGSDEGTGQPRARLSGSIDIDGSSTVFPIAEAVAEEFGREQGRVKVTVGIKGTGGGFQRFCSGETAISNASRPITAKEIEACQAKGIEFIELPVAYDALSVVVNPRNDFVSCITVAELKKMWEPAAQGTISKWNQVNPSWPDSNLKLFGPGTDSGTFDYFTEHVNGRAKDSRGDFTASEDDNVLVQGVAGDRNALGYFGLAYYLENQGKLKALLVNQDKGCVAPSAQTVENGTYPLSRPLFIYVRKSEAAKPEVKAFVDFFLKNAGALAADVGYVKFPASIYTQVSARWSAGKTGTMYGPGTSSGTPLQQLLSQ